ncbi:MAG TPA: YbaB/EbfC family nucleoid-associated protein [Ktedonobacteraceae bacterium]|nr:YbaB/EbfC family nucleoid-associated protein [Ktedonobacteraceae bacterium]
MNMREMQKMQQKLVKMQEELEKTLFAGTAGGGAVSVTVNGKSEITAVKIDPEAFNAEDIGELEVMILAAAKDAQGKANEAQERLAMNVTGGLRIPGLF